MKIKTNRKQIPFGLVPNRNIERSGFKGQSNHKTTFNTGKLVPLNVKEVVPSDIVKADLAFAVRTTTPIAPVMDVATITTEAFLFQIG